MPTPFVDEIFTFRQPDGTKVQLRGTGNQFEARFETLDGHAVAADTTSGFFHFANPASTGSFLKTLGIRVDALSPEQFEAAFTPVATAELPPALGFPDRSLTRWQARRHERRQVAQFLEATGVKAAPPERPTVGEFVGLTLLIDFPDVHGTISRDEVERFCNQPGYTGYGNNGSVRDYFLEVSEGKLDYRNIVTPYCRAKHDRDYYTNEKVPQPQRAIELMLEAIDAAKAAGFDFGPLTVDSKGFVYAMNAFYAGARVNNWSKGLWPHAHHLNTPKSLGPGRNTYDYQITNMGAELTLGTFCHENGHMICDFPDLYDYGSQSSGVGVFCLMCSGGSKPYDKNPGHVGAYLKRAAGWVSDETEMNAGATVTLSAGKNEFAIFAKSATEYIIAESRAKAGRDMCLPAGGIAIWHVDELGDNSNEQMTAKSHYECTLVQADGKNDLEKKRNQGDAGDLFRAGGKDYWGGAGDANARWWDGSAVGVAVSGIGPAGPSITFKVG